MLAGRRASLGALMPPMQIVFSGGGPFTGWPRMMIVSPDITCIIVVRINVVVVVIASWRREETILTMPLWMEPVGVGGGAALAAALEAMASLSFSL